MGKLRAVKAAVVAPTLLALQPHPKKLTLLAAVSQVHVHGHGELVCVSVSEEAEHPGPDGAIPVLAKLKAEGQSGRESSLTTTSPSRKSDGGPNPVPTS